MILPIVPRGHWAVFLTCLCWSVTEVIRFSFYSLKLLNVSPSSFSNYIIGGLRYNLFIILYPLGVTGELLSCYQVWQYLGSLPDQQPKPFTVTMPNPLNISFHFEAFLLFCVPLVYALCFPPLYMYLWNQRAKHNLEIQRSYLEVPLKFKHYKPLRDLLRLNSPGDCD
mmetsp:Transcript_5586/g.9599  ORF Transcript_5586/g.9599 Transcript_5586/m.9599 type:complete len:168 (+) Transcript_5586:291-794(+)